MSLKITPTAVPSLKILHKLKNHENEEIAFCEEDSKLYQWRDADSKWHEFIPKNVGNLNISLYDLNQNTIDHLPTLTETQLKPFLKQLDEYQQKNKDIHNFLLLSNEYRYYTIFSNLMKGSYSFGYSVLDIIYALGNIKSIEYIEKTNSFEIWIYIKNKKTSYVFYLFPYDRGVVYYE